MEGTLSVYYDSRAHNFCANVQKQIYDIVLTTCTSRALLLLIFCILQGSVVTRLRCGGKYDTSLVENLLLSSTVKEFLKSTDISQSYERISSGTFLCITYNKRTPNVNQLFRLVGPFITPSFNEISSLLLR